MKDIIKKFYKQEYLFLFFILIFGLILRIWQLGTPNFWVDESISSLISQKIVESGIPLFDSGVFYSRAILFHYLEAFFLIFSQTDFAARLVSVVFGLATIVLAFYVGKEYDKTAGLVAALFTAIFLFEIVYSRQARFYQMFQFLFFLTLFFLYKSKNNKNYAWLATGLLVVLINTQIAGLVLLPIFFYSFYKDQKDKKLFIIPIVITLYYLVDFLGLFSGSSQGVTNYSEKYTTQLYLIFRGFLPISIIGLYFSFKKNLKMTLYLLIPTILLFVGLFFLKTYALRYSYFLVFALIIFFSMTFSEIRKYSKVLFILALAFAIIYPSNLVFTDEPLTIIKPEKIEYLSKSEPIMDYKGLNENTFTIIKQNKLVCLFSASCEWYFHKPDYIIPFSMSGLPNNYMIKNNIDIYTGAEIFSGQIKEFILVEDLFSYSKLNEEERQNYEEVRQNCNLIDYTGTVFVYSCE